MIHLAEESFSSEATPSTKSLALLSRENFGLLLKIQPLFEPYHPAQCLHGGRMKNRNWQWCLLSCSVLTILRTISSPARLRANLEFTIECGRGAGAGPAGAFLLKKPPFRTCLQVRWWNFYVTQVCSHESTKEETTNRHKSQRKGPLARILSFSMYTNP